MTSNKVYILSGPAGVGKSTTSKELVKRLNHSAYISGDYVSHMHKSGRKKPWESKEETALIWDNILSLTKNFLKYENDVVVDYVAFPQEAKWLRDHLNEFQVDIIYVVLWTDKKTLTKRDNMREPEHRMGERSIILYNEFLESAVEEAHLLDTSKVSIQSVINEVMSNPTYKLKC